jgi:hypothetical protein
LNRIAKAKEARGSKQRNLFIDKHKVNMLYWAIISPTTVLPLAANTNTDGCAPIARAQDRQERKSHGNRLDMKE